MIEGFIKFNRGVFKMPVGWQLWLMVLVTLNMVVPLFHLDYFEAQVVLGVFMASAMLFTVMTARFGFTRLLGLGHIFWVPLLIFLATRLDQYPADAFFGIWLRALIFLNAVSLVIDTVDVIRYIRGDRKETVSGL